MKLVASRLKDEDDLAELLVVCELQQAGVDEVAGVLDEAYPGEDQLSGMLGVPASDPAATHAEAIARAQAALALL